MASILAYLRAADNQIQYYRPFRVETVSIDELCKVNYHYDAVIGYGAVWEFVKKDGTSMDVSFLTLGLRKTLGYLENHLDGFTMKNFKQMFEEGDVVDSLPVWKIR